ncbi:cytochrome c [Colwellia demingiae]|uniref:Cytochrome c n=1 Tax=Colwellia demingiae TaxID=89401 RepID=A0A5C6Q9B0_9GAMM|nr:cytochrome c [Colwellia demingiae]TWX65615.1 cytochrome c [Colwellia demingiae]
MRWRYFIILQAIILLVVAGLVYKHQDKVKLIKTPPIELAKWYKPENKRQVWLHNMFKLRREMQAVEFYAQQQDVEHLQIWAEKLNKHYFKIADMVPAWQKKLAINTMAELKLASEQKDFTSVLVQHETLQKSCDSCHDDYQAITALTYRTPDFSNIQITPKLSFVEHMDILTRQVNQIKISAQDGNKSLALSSLAGLNDEMATLGETCVGCHKKDRKPYPSEVMKKTLSSLKTSIESGTAKQQGRDLGTLAVLACARCHGTHRIAYGAKKHLVKDVSFSNLIKH